MVYGARKKLGEQWDMVLEKARRAVGHSARDS